MIRIALPLIALATLFAETHARLVEPSPDQALEMLLDGNKHFIHGEITHLSYMAEAKDKLLEKQMPFAVIVGCSDARVPPELIFDRGLGELFVVRDAGNVVGPIEMDSVEFAVAKLNTPLVLVMGHQNCGAITAALNGRDHVPELDQIFPLIDAALAPCKMHKDKTRKLVQAIECNVRKGVETLKNSPTIAPLIAKGKVKVLGAYFDMVSGEVRILSDVQSAP
jgi:carbonic anhydrase